MEFIAFLIDFVIHVDKHLATFVLNYGTWVYALLFLIIFMMVKLVNRTRRQHEVAAPPPAPNPQEVLLTEIRDLLRDQRR